MASVFDVAKYILRRCGKRDAWSLQKLCWYAQGHHGAWTGRALFDEDFEAWRGGPVCYELNRSRGDRFVLLEDDLPQGDPGALTKDERESLDIVLERYGKLKPYELRDAVREETSWSEARKGVAPDSPNGPVIPKESIFASFAEDIENVREVVR